jgi:hypothetical protein
MQREIPEFRDVTYAEVFVRRPAIIRIQAAPKASGECHLRRNWRRERNWDPTFSAGAQRSPAYSSEELRRTNREKPNPTFPFSGAELRHHLGSAWRERNWDPTVFANRVVVRKPLQAFPFGQHAAGRIQSSLRGRRDGRRKVGSDWEPVHQSPRSVLVAYPGGSCRTLDDVTRPYVLPDVSAETEA